MVKYFVLFDGDAPARAVFLSWLISEGLTEESSSCASSDSRYKALSAIQRIPESARSSISQIRLLRVTDDYDASGLVLGGKAFPNLHPA